MIVSIDDGCASDMRAAELLQKYDVEGIFYWPLNWHSIAYSKGYKPLSFEDAFDISRLFEIGSHTLTHRHLTTLGEDDLEDEIIGSKQALELLFQTDINKFCPPRGYTNPQITALTLEHYDNQRLTKGKHLVHIHPDSGANDGKPWRECISKDTKELWGHSHEFDRYNMWEEIEEVLREIATHGK